MTSHSDERRRRLGWTGTSVDGTEETTGRRTKRTFVMDIERRVKGVELIDI